MPWIQRGVVYTPDGKKAWSRTHAQSPAALEINGRIRVYFGTRDQDNRSRTSFVELDRHDPTKLLYVHDRPVIDLGKPGTHDEDGVLASHVIPVGDELWMYYGGVSRGGSVPYRMSIGLARSRDGGLTFERMYAGPVVDRTPDEPYMTMAPYVLRTGSGWRMWYGSGIRWVQGEDKYEPVYIIKTAQSADGMRWVQPNHTCIQPLGPTEANTRPAVLRTATGYEMWFCYRQSLDYRDGPGSYRIGHAVSTDGLAWTRSADQPGLAPTASGWNAATMAYPSVIVIDGKKLMFHNGDGFGRTGFGCAVWSDAAEAAAQG